MKKLTLITLLISGLAFAGQAQSINAKTYIENTYLGPKLGTAIGVTFDCQIEVGAFYQKNSFMLGKTEATSKLYERQFLGFFMNYPMKKWVRAGVDLNIRTGASNGENFLITPSILAYVQPFKQIKIGGGLGVRAFTPTYQASISISLSK